MKIEDVFNLDPIGKSNLKIRTEIKQQLSKLIGEKVETIESFSDDFYQSIDLAVFDHENDEKIACLILNQNHYFNPTIADWPIKFSIFEIKAKILECYGWKVIQIPESEWTGLKTQDDKKQYLEQKIKGSET